MGQHKLSPLQGFLAIIRFLTGKLQYVPALHRDNVCINLSNAIKVLNLFLNEFFFPAEQMLNSALQRKETSLTCRLAHQN